MKNNNRSIQYKVYIYLGPLVSKKILTILNTIKDKDFINTLLNINKDDYNQLEELYGEFWYEKFFLSYHINAQIKDISNNKKKDLETKYGKQWYNKHFLEEHRVKVKYSFANAYYDYLLMMNKIKTQTRKVEMDFRTFGEDNIKKSIELDIQEGGNDEAVEETVNEDNEDDDVEEVIDDETFQDKLEEQLNEQDISNLYLTQENESKQIVNSTAELISKAINDNKWIKNTDHLENTFDSSQEDLTYNAELKNVYNKYYITDQYIFKDDTIRIMRNKITTTIPLSNKFGKNIKLLPECQYFWSEYELTNNKTDYVMLGQKWVRRNELLKVDIKPNENIKVYEKLYGNLSYIKESMGLKIKREDDEANIIRYYDQYITMNEIFMIDIYNELGLTYNVDQELKHNLYDVYIKIYYPMISFDRLEQIISLLNGNNSKELTYIESQFGPVRNDIKLDAEIEEMVEKTKLLLTSKFDKLFSVNHIIQSIIHVNINDPKNITGTTVDNKFNLYRIFDNYIVNDKYPFIQYQTPDGYINYKFYNIDNENTLLAKWFETNPFGVSFKIKVGENKYLSINLHESGKIEYKITWKEEEEATADDINKSFDVVRELLKKINSENKKVKFMLPDDDRFHYAFINTIQKFTIPEKYKINHNDLSDFSRFFYPYVALVIEPRKRLSKSEVTDKVSKYGTYLRYKRISKYDNKIKMHLRILYFLRNYDLSDKEILNEITKQFNITPEVAAVEIDFVRDKFSKIIKKSSKMQKKMTKITKSKPPGVGIDIQGRDKDNYKIRITGARDKSQLVEIIEFMKVLIYLYVETYLYKNPEYTKIKTILTTLNKIAKRRNKVVEIVEYENEVNKVKEITSLDKARLGFRPEKGQNQWTRSCQNSGTTKKRRPDIYPAEQLSKLLSDGFKLNPKNKYYEKEVKADNGKKVTIKAITLPGDNNSVNYFTCDPEKNKEHIYIGFLSKGNNPNDLCMPCCFKKDQTTANNKKKQLYFNKCLGEQVKETQDEIITADTDKLYILQDTNKVQEGRYIFLPKYLDIFFNKLWKHDYKIKNHYLYESKSGYFFKYTVKHDKYHFLIAIANIFNITIDNIKDKLIDFIKKDKDEIYFTYLNNGDIKLSFNNKKSDYINYINSSNYLGYDIVGELCGLPGVITKNGINYYIFEKKKDQYNKEKYYLMCLNYENNYLQDKNRDIVILIKDDNYYFPIYRVYKDEKLHKKINIQKHFDINDSIKNIILELKKYYSKSCYTNFINQITPVNKLNTKSIIELLNVKEQYIDERNKCRYIKLDNGLYLPTSPSGISNEYPFDYIKNIKKWSSLEETNKLLDKTEKILKLNYSIKSIFYNNTKGSNINITSVLLHNDLTLPIKNEYVDEKTIKKMGFSIKFQPLEETIDNDIIEFNEYLSNKKEAPVIYDERIKNVKQRNYLIESYNLYRLELSLYISNNDDIKKQIIDIVRNSPNISNNEKRDLLKKILFKLFNSKVGSENGFGYINKDLPDLKKYVVSNIRDYCTTNKNNDKCSANPHCIWKNNSCKLLIHESVGIDFINKVLEEMIQNGIKFKEILQEGSYYVSDIVDNTQYTNRPSQKIVNSSNYNINKVIAELFGNTNIPTIGKKHFIHTLNIIDDEIIPELVNMEKYYIQQIISNKDSVIRAYINSYYWLNNPLYDTESRNLGYISELQTNLTYLFKANMIDWVQNNINKGDENIKKALREYFKDSNNFFDSTINKFRKSSFNTNGKMELFILSHMIDKPIIVYDNYFNIKYIYLQGEQHVNQKTIDIFTSEKKLANSITLKFEYDGYNDIPRIIHSIYYI